MVQLHSAGSQHSYNLTMGTAQWQTLNPKIQFYYIVSQCQTTTGVLGSRITGGSAQEINVEPLCGTTTCLPALTLHMNTSQPVTNDASPLHIAALL